jgi:hypothetical protein
LGINDRPRYLLSDGLDGETHSNDLLCCPAELLELNWIVVLVGIGIEQENICLVHHAEIGLKYHGSSVQDVFDHQRLCTVSVELF